MREEIKTVLLGLKEHGLKDEDIESLEAMVDGTNRAIEDEGLVNREDEAPEAGVAEVAEPDPEPEAEGEPEDEDEAVEVAPAFELDDGAVQAIAAQVVEMTGLDTYAAQLDDLRTMVEGIDRRLSKEATDAQDRAKDTASRLEALEAEEAEKERRWQADLPRRQPVQVSYRPREARDPARQDDGKPQRGELAEVADATLAAMPRY